MRLLVVLALVASLGCVTTKISKDGTLNVYILGKGSAEVLCIKEHGETVCAVEVVGDGLTENAVAVFGELFTAVVSIPGTLLKSGVGLF